MALSDSLPEPFELGGAKLAMVTLAEATHLISDLGTWRRGGHVVTANLDHLRLLRSNLAFRQAYEHSKLQVADGVPLLWLGRLAGTPLPGRVNGTDLVDALCAACADRDLAIAMVGGGPGVADAAASGLMKRHMGLRVAGTLSPPYGFDQDPKQSLVIAQKVAEFDANLVFLGLGTPRQELWADAHGATLNRSTIICIGGSLDFFAGVKSRAPRIVQRIGLEWAHRLVSDPRRLGGRYFRDALHLPLLASEALRLRWRRSVN